MAGILEFLSAGLFTKNVSVDEDSIRWQNGLVGKLHAATEPSSDYSHALFLPRNYLVITLDASDTQTTAL